MSFKVRIRVGLLALALAAVVGAAGAAEAEPCNQRCQEGLRLARDFTGKYWELPTAAHDGFVESSECEPSSTGTLGIRYTNPARSSDQTVDVTQPESLIYMPDGLNKLGRRLVGVEYSVPAEEGQPRPELFGRPFDGPTEPLSPGGAPQYRLRVWLFADNPNGIFAPANPAEACTGATLVAPHAYEEGVHEVFAFFSLPAKHVREVVDVPEEFRLRGEDAQGGGNAELYVDARFSNWSSGEGAATATNVAIPLLALEAPDWAGDRSLTSLYPLRTFTDNPEFAKWVQQGMGVGSEVIAHSDDIVRSFNPIIGIGDPNYRFSSPDFVLEATAPDPPPASVLSTSIRVWHESPRGMGVLRLWHDAGRLGEAAVRVTPTPGTDLARLLKCNNADSCDPKQADNGLVVTTQARTPYTAGVSRELWSPRQGTANVIGL